MHWHVLPWQETEHGAAWYGMHWHSTEDERARGSPRTMSYSRRFSGSDRVSYACATSLNFSSASSLFSMLRSGCHFLEHRTSDHQRMSVLNHHQQSLVE
eukprot:365323-Chlamydomonas_euryale.AAC.15